MCSAEAQTMLSNIMVHSGKLNAQLYTDLCMVPARALQRMHQKNGRRFDIASVASELTRELQQAQGEAAPRATEAADA